MRCLSIKEMWNDLAVEEEVEEKPALAGHWYANIVFEQIFGKRFVPGVLVVHLTVVPRQVLVVGHFAIPVELVTQRGPGSKEGNGVDSVKASKKKIGDEKPMRSLFSKLLF